MFECFFDIYVLGNPTWFVPNSSVLKVTPVHVKGHPTRLTRVGFRYPFDIYILGNPMGFVPNSFVLRITPVLGKDTLLAWSSSFMDIFTSFFYLDSPTGFILTD